MSDSINMNKKRKKKHNIIKKIITFQTDKRIEEKTTTTKYDAKLFKRRLKTDKYREYKTADCSNINIYIY